MVGSEVKEVNAGVDLTRRNRWVARDEIGFHEARVIAILSIPFYRSESKAERLRKQNPTPGNQL